MDECSGSKCDDAVDALISSMNGKPLLFGTDFLKALYEGNSRSNDEYYRGYQDMITSKGAYVLTLICAGIQVQSAYASIRDKKKDSWQLVQERFGPEV